MPIRRVVALSLILSLFCLPVLGQNGNSDLLSRIRQLVDRGLPVLLVEQNVKAALKVVDHLYLLERGKIVGEGSADVMAADHRIIEAYLGTIADGTPS